MTAEIESYVFKGIGLTKYPIIERRNPDLKAFCQAMENQTNAVDCVKFVHSKEPTTWDMINIVDYLTEEELLFLVQRLIFIIKSCIKERINLSSLSRNKLV